MRRWLLGLMLSGGILTGTFCSQLIAALPQDAGQTATAQAANKDDRSQDEDKAEAAEEPSLYDNVVEQLSTRYVDEDFRENKLPELVERYRPLAEAAETLEEAREATHALLRNIPATHLGLFSRTSYDRLMGELRNRSGPCLGFEVLDLDGKFYVHNLLEGGPAEQAGLRRGDRVVSVDGVLTEDSPRLDWRTDDAFLADAPITVLMCEEGETLQLEIERTWGNMETVEVTAAEYSTWEAAKASAKVIEHEGTRLGYIHFWLIHLNGIPELLKNKLEGDFADCDALVLDLRGRGGAAHVIQPMLEILSGESSDWDKPVVALIDNESRSAKEVISFRLREENIARLVGERTAGAVIPATFQDVGHDTILMFPTFRLGRFTDEIEGIGVPPDVYVARPGPYSGGKDPILEAGKAEALRMISEEAATSAAGESKSGEAAVGAGR